MLLDQVEHDKLMITAGRSREAEAMAAMHTPKSVTRQCHGCNWAQQLKRSTGALTLIHNCPTPNCTHVFKFTKSQLGKLLYAA